MKLNTKNLSVRTTLNGEATTVDITAQLAEAVYQSATTYAAHKLAHKIDEGSGEIDIDESEARIIKQTMSGASWRFCFQRPILEQLGEKFE